MSRGLLWLWLLLLMSLPLAGVAWIRWRLRPSRMHRAADRRLAEVAARMAKLSDEELAAVVRACPRLNRNMTELLELGGYAALDQAWRALFAERGPREILLGDLDQALEVSAALQQLVARQEAR